MIIKKVTITNRNYGGDGHTIAENTGISNTEGKYVYDSYFKAFPDLRKFWDVGFARASHFGFIEYNNVTRRKCFFNDSNYYFKYKDEIGSPIFRATTPNYREIVNKYDKDKGELQRHSQNYPRFVWGFIQ